MPRKKTLWTVAGVVSSLILLSAGGLVWLHTHLASAAEILLARYLDAGATIERIDLDYFPDPAIVVVNLDARHNGKRVHLPRARVVLDMDALLDGRIDFDEAVLNHPRIGLDTKKDESGPNFDPDALFALVPNRLVVEMGEVALNDVSGTPQPFTLTAVMEKVTPGLTLRFRRMVIEEFGLEFSGTLEMGGGENAPISIKANTATLNPTEFLAFLERFEFVDGKGMEPFKHINRLEATELDFQFAPEAKGLSLVAQSFRVDKSSLNDVQMEFTPKRFRMVCSSGTLDAGNVYAMIRNHDAARIGIDATLTKAGLQSLGIGGMINISEVDMTGLLGKSTDITGSFALQGSGLALDIVSTKGERQTFTVRELDTTVRIDKGRPAVTVNELSLASGKSGILTASGRLPVPFAFEKARFSLEAETFRVFSNTLSLSANKTSDRKTGFSLDLEGADYSVRARGMLRTFVSNSPNVEAVLASLTIRRDDEDGTPETDFNFKGWGDSQYTARARIKDFRYNDLTRVSDLVMDILGGNGRTVVKGEARLCRLPLTIQMVMHDSQLAVQAEIRGKGVDLSGVIACFSAKLPVFLKGRLYARGAVFMQGANPTQMRESMTGDVTVALKTLKVFKLGEIDPRLSFFLDILHAANLNREEHDTLSFSRGQIKAALADNRVSLNRFSLNGNLMETWGSGSYSLADSRLQIDATVKTALGVTNTISIDRKLGETEGKT